MKEDIIRMAREAGAWSQQFKNRDVEYVLSAESLERFFHMAQAAEREACAQVAEKFGYARHHGVITDQIATAIRTRGQDPMPLFDDWNKDWR